MSVLRSPSEWPLVQEVLVAVLALAVLYVLWRIAREEFRTATTRTVAYAVVLAAVAAALSPFSVPMPGGLAKPYPAQHMVNIMAAVLVGPWWATLVAFVAAVIRNTIGTGSPLAFPGGMIGALLAGLAWRATRNMWVAAAGEIVGTGIIAAVVSGLLVAPAMMAKQTTAATYIGVFLASTLVGTTVGVAALLALRRADVVEFGGETP